MKNSVPAEMITIHLHLRDSIHLKNKFETIFVGSNEKYNFCDFFIKLPKQKINRRGKNREEGEYAEKNHLLVRLLEKSLYC
jgi:hypothetical protein